MNKTYILAKLMGHEYQSPQRVLSPAGTNPAAGESVEGPATEGQWYLTGLEGRDVWHPSWLG